MSEVGYTCAHCGTESFHPRDLEERYCGRCHHFCDDVDMLAKLGLVMQHETPLRIKVKDVQDRQGSSVLPSSPFAR